MLECNENDKKYFKKIADKTKSKHKNKIEKDSDYVYLNSWWQKGNIHAKVVYKPWNTIDITRGVFNVVLSNYADKGTRPHKKAEAVAPGKSLLELRPDIAKTILIDSRNNLTESDLYDITLKSNATKVYTTCLECGTKIDKKRDLNHIVTYLKQCPKCSDQISYGEKYIFSLLTELGYTVIRQYSKVNAEWIKAEYKYDFYIIELDMIIEVHGIQHYENTNFNGHRTIAKEQQEIDDKKKKLASKKVKFYIEINASKSSPSWIKKEAEKELSKYITIKLSDDKWNTIAKEAMKSIKQKALRMRQENVDITPREVGELLCVNKKTITEWFKELDEIGVITYNPKRTCLDNSPKKIIGINIHTGEKTEPYKSILKAEKSLGLSSKGINQALKGRCFSIYGYIWMYYENYKLLTEYEINNKIKTAKKSYDIRTARPIIVKDRNRLYIFSSQAKVSEALNISRATVKRRLENRKILLNCYELMYV